MTFNKYTKYHRKTHGISPWVLHLCAHKPNSVVGRSRRMIICLGLRLLEGSSDSPVPNESGPARSCMDVRILPFHPHVSMRLLPKESLTFRSQASLLAPRAGRQSRPADGYYPLHCCTLPCPCSDFPLHEKTCSDHRALVLYNRFNKNQSYLRA